MEVDLLLEELQKSIVELNQKRAEEITKKCIELKIQPEKMIKTISEGLKIVGEKYENNEYFLPELVTAGNMMTHIINMVKPLLKAENIKATGKICIGTVKGDIHDLGKSIVIAMLRSAGFEVIDLGVDVPPEKFVNFVRKERPDILAMSALLSTTREEMKAVIDALERASLRNNVKILVGGGAVTQDFARKIGADAYGKDAMEAVEICRRLI